MTLRQLFYRLVAAQLIPNTSSAYKTLSDRTAKARRSGEFPDLLDRTRLIHERPWWHSPSDALAALAEQYRRDPSEGQPVQLFVGVEKAGLVAQLDAWFGDRVPVLALSGYSSQTFVDDVRGRVHDDGRPAVLVYGGDHDASGEDIDRDFIARTDCWVKVVRVALSADQIEEFGLPPAPGKATDSRSARFVARYGELVQVELDALDPGVLCGLYAAEVGRWWDADAHAAIVEAEAAERVRIKAIADREVAA